MFKYPPEIRTLIYTTNAIENFNRQLRKVTKTKSAFVSDDALMKILYLATMNITEKSTMPIKNWGSILDHLSIYFAYRSLHCLARPDIVLPGPVGKRQGNVFDAEFFKGGVNCGGIGIIIGPQLYRDEDILSGNAGLFDALSNGFFITLAYRSSA